MKPAAKKRTPQPIPQGYEGATPYLCVKGAADAVDFYKKAFGATKTMRIAQADGRIGHAEIRIGQAVIMLADGFPEMNLRSPSSLGGSPVTLHLYVEDVDAFAKHAVAAGIKVLRPVEKQFYGFRGGRFEDPFGQVWWIATHQEDFSPEEIKKRMTSLFPPKQG